MIQADFLRHKPRSAMARSQTSNAQMTLACGAWQILLPEKCAIKYPLTVSTGARSHPVCVARQLTSSSTFYPS